MLRCLAATRSEPDVTNFTRLPTWADKEHVHAVVETPRLKFPRRR